MPLVALSALRSQAQTRADMVNSPFVPTAEWNVFINKSAAALYDMLVASFEDYYTKASATLTATVNGQGTYALDADFYKLAGIDIKVSSSEYKSLRPYVWRERNVYRNLPLATPPEYETRYRVRAGSLELLPVPTSVLPMTVWYVPTMAALTVDADTFDGINGFEEYIVLDAARKALMKEESDTSDVERELAALVERIQTMAAERDVGEPERVGDVYRDDWGSY